MRELTVVQGLAREILKDISNFHPTYSDIEMQRDLSHLLKMSQYRGMAYFTITLPECCDVLHTTLADGELPQGYRLPSMGKRSSQDRRPRFLGGLYELILDECGRLRSDADSSVIASLRQIYLFAKKLKLPCKERKVEHAIQTFREIEYSLPHPNEETFSVDNPVWIPRHGHPIWGCPSEEHNQGYLFSTGPSVYGNRGSDSWERFRNLVTRLGTQFGYLDAFSLRPKHGPGATYDKLGIKDDFLFWNRKLQSVFPYDWFGSYNYKSDYIEREFPSRLLAVPKSQKGPRLIAAEPSSHQWIQGGIQRWLEENVRKTFLGDCISFSDQGPSQAMALSASLDSRYATIDLKSASDRLTCRLVEYVFQSNTSLLDALHASRTRYNEVVDGEFLVLRKFATQGSACTFPVQTIVYAVMALFSVMETRDIDPRQLKLREIRQLAKETVRVFGDDIIVPTDSVEACRSLLETCMLSVNASKSFSSGYFRESCGMDAYRGVDVTPCYYRQIARPQDPESIVSTIEVSNNFHMKGYWNAASYITSTLSKYQHLIPVLAVDSGQLGMKSFCGTSIGHLSKSDQCKPARMYQTPHVLVIGLTSSKRRKGHQAEGQLFSYLSRKKEPRWYDGVIDSINPLGSGQHVNASLILSKAWVPTSLFD